MITLDVVGLAAVTVGNFSLGALASYLYMCTVSNAQANPKVVKALGIVGLLGIVPGAVLAVPYKEKPKPTINKGSSQVFERKSEPHTD